MTPSEAPRTLAIDLIIPTLGHGGAQRMVSRIASWLAERGHAVRVITFTGPDQPIVHRPAADVEILPIGTHLGTRFSARSLVPVLGRLRRTVRGRGPDVVLSFQDIASFPTLVTLASVAPIAVAERHDPDTYSHPRVRAALRRVLYPRAAAIVVQTRMLASRYAPSLQGRIEILPNPCPDVSRTARPGTAPTATDGTPVPRRMVTVGRLERTKELTLLVDAACIAFGERDGWNLDIHGTGPLQADLEARIAEREVGDRVHLLGHCEDVPAALAEAQLFVFPSSTEGFPNALAEAIACGLPCIAYHGVSGVDELVRDGENGVLLDADARDAGRLARALVRMMDDDDARARMGERSLAIAREFDAGRLLAEWERLLLAIVAERHPAARSIGR